MKLSVKWLAGLAVLALAVVAVVGSTSATKAATGSIFVANEWSKVTNESPAPTGFTSRSTVFATYDNPGSRIIRTDSDFIRVIVEDSGINQATTTLADGTAEVLVAASFQGMTANSISAAAGSSVLITLVGAGTSAPIAGTLADVQANTKITAAGSPGELNNDELQITNFFAGSAGGPPLITVFVNIGIVDEVITVEYETSTIGTFDTVVTSELDTTGVSVSVVETALGSGRFLGFVQVVSNTISSAPSTGAHDKAGAGKISTNVGPITLTWVDSDSVSRETTVSIDTTAPVPSITGPLDKSATQNLNPTFSGTVSETGSGLKIDDLKVFYDDTDTSTNGTPVVSTSTAALKTGAIDLAVSTTGALDGDTAFSFSKAPSGSGIPSVGLPNPDHIVDWAIIAADLAGNVGISDADTSTSGIQLPTVKVDKVVPAFSTVAADHRTGLANSSTGEVVARNSLRVAFNDDVTNVQASDFTVTLDNGAVIVPTAVTIQNDSTTGPFLKTVSSTAQSLVYLEFANDLVSNETPLVSLQDIISDLAGNFISQGDRAVGDGIAPSLTVTLSGGSGTGQALATGEGPDKLTNDKITITIVSDEPLSGSPTVAVFQDDGTSSPPADTPAPTALAQGSNTWIATYSKPASPTDGKRAIEITSVDVGSNTGTTGGKDADVSTTPSFTLDTSLADPNLTVGGGAAATDQRRPSIIIDYKTVVTGPPAKGGEASTVTLTKVTLDGTDITADVVAASDGKRFFYIPPSDLSLGDHELVIAAGDAEDAAGNDNATDTELTVTIEERGTFNLDIFAGWNALSFPSDPVDPSLNSVFTNAGHDAVLGFDPSVPGQWRVAVRDTVSGLLEPATEGGLTSVRSTQAYWVHSNNFEQVTVLLVGEVLPAAGSPPGIITIPTVLGFNAVPVVDTSRKLTEGPSVPLTRQPAGGGSPVAVTVADYLGAVVEGRVYRWNPEILSFELLTGASAVNTGDVLFVEVTGTPVPIFP